MNVFQRTCILLVGIVFLVSAIGIPALVHVCCDNPVPRTIAEATACDGCCAEEAIDAGDTENQGCCREIVTVQQLDITAQIGAPTVIPEYDVVAILPFVATHAVEPEDSSVLAAVRYRTDPSPPPSQRRSELCVFII